MNITTIQQLDEWMTANCYNDSYGIGDRMIHEGYGLDFSDGLFRWYYTERGSRQKLEFFQTEEQAVAYAFKAMAADKSANRHLVGFVKGKADQEELSNELAKRNIEYWTDSIPYGGPDDPRIRFFVFGCDVKKTTDLAEKYCVLQ